MRSWIDRLLFTHKATLHGNFELLKLRISAASNITVNFEEATTYKCGPGSSVGIATGYGLDGPGIVSR
jgi:hypothetical protein